MGVEFKRFLNPNDKKISKKMDGMKEMSNKMVNSQNIYAFVFSDSLDHRKITKPNKINLSGRQRRLILTINTKII